MNKEYILPEKRVVNRLAMKVNRKIIALLITVFFGNTATFASTHRSSAYQDVPFLQDYSIKFYHSGNDLSKVFTDRNNNIQILGDDGLYQPFDGEFLYPGTIEKDQRYRSLATRKIADMLVCREQFVYLDDVAVLSNAWAGKLFDKHEFKKAALFTAGKDFEFLVSDGKKMKLIQDGKVLWEGQSNSPILDLKYTSENNLFWILSENAVSKFSIQDKKIIPFFKGSGFTSFDLVSFNSKTIIGTSNGYLEVDNLSGNQIGDRHANLPCPEITAVSEIEGKLWFGSTSGAFMLKDDGKFNYYSGERWLPGNRVKYMSEGPDHSVLILTNQGLGQICFKEMTLNDKAMFYEKQVRSRHIRNGFNATLSRMDHGKLSTGYLSDSDNDGLWTAMYLGSQVFRYSVTKSDEALQNCRESLDALERLFTINPVPGFPSRSFERAGFIDVLADPERWQHAPDPEWDWKATTSSDEAIGHIFALGALAELVDQEDMQLRAVHLIDEFMQHIVDHDFYMVDYDGKPTTWGRWNPEYVNARPKVVGDRKINSSNIIAMLQTAYHFTKKEIYKEKALELMTKYDYLENLMRPMNEIGHAPDDADELSKDLSDAWNHSDDEMYFIGYWGLYRYALNDTLRADYQAAIIDHWEMERPEKEGAWNLFTALTTDQFDLDEAVWYLQEHPLDMITWDVVNSNRKDIQLIPENFRQQTTEEVLPPDERPVQRHNSNMFRLDRIGGNGNSECSAGDIWLLPYWLGRYLDVISAPVDTK